MSYHQHFVEVYVDQILRATINKAQPDYTSQVHIDLWSLWSTSGALFEKKLPDLSPQLKKNALPFVYQAAELARLFTQTAMFAKLVAKPDEKGKFRRILAVNLSSLFNFVFYKTRTAFMTQAKRSGTSVDSIYQLGRAHDRQKMLASGMCGASLDFPLYDQQQSLEFEAFVWKAAGDFSASIGDFVSADQARTLRLTALNKFVKLVGFTQAQVDELAPQFTTLNASQLAELAEAALVTDMVGYVIPVFWGMLSGSPSTTIANTIAGLGIWSTSLARLLDAGIPRLGLSLNTQAGDDLDAYSANPVSAIGVYRIISSEFTMRDSDWMYRAGTSVFLKVLYRQDKLVGFINRALIPFVQRSPSSALSVSPVQDISELNDLRDLLELRGADIGALSRYYYRAADSILTSFKIPTSTTARHIPAKFGGLGVLPLDYTRSIVRAARVQLPRQDRLEATPTDLLSRGAAALAKKAGRPELVSAAEKKLFRQAASGVVEYTRDPLFRAESRAAWAGFNPHPSDFVVLRTKPVRPLDLSEAISALARQESSLPRAPLRSYDQLSFSLLSEEFGQRGAMRILKKEGKLPQLVASFPHYSLQEMLGSLSFPVLTTMPISALISPYLSEAISYAVLRSSRTACKDLSFDASYAHIAATIEATLTQPAVARVLAAYAA